jgi:hypothetical protein
MHPQRVNIHMPFLKLRILNDKFEKKCGEWNSFFHFLVMSLTVPKTSLYQFDQATLTTLLGNTSTGSTWYTGHASKVGLAMSLLDTNHDSL